jgi:aryl-alcohol dehydrogenase-like predicted oxidoreductase/enamine deaminase RidA (YjgF/YER057c/UK114 family)
MASPSPERIQLAQGLQISRVLTGLWQIADMERDGGGVDLAAAARAMEPYLDAGLTTFDMADHYGSAEDIVGAHRSGGGETTRGEFLTKWVPPVGALRPEDVRGAVDTALERMRGDRIDLLQFHAWAYWDPSWLDALFALGALRDEGLVGALGLTNFDAAHCRVALASGIPVVSNQVCYSLLDRRPAQRLGPLCQDTGLHLLCYGTLAGGLLTEGWLGRDEVAADDMPTWSLMKYKRFLDAAGGGWDAFQGLLQVLRDVARARGVSMANVASRYVLDQPGVAGVIVGARLGASEHVDETLQLFTFELSDEERRALDEAADRIGRIPGDSGDEYRRPPFLTAAGDLSHHLDALPAPYEPRAGTASDRTHVLSGTVWEDIAGFSRAVRSGNTIRVSGTTATHGEHLIGGDDPAAQAHFCIDKLEGAIRSLGGELEHVVRTRVFVRDLEDWEPVARAHGERFAGIQPANTLVQAGLVGDGYRVEMEADAEIPDC